MSIAAISSSFVAAVRERAPVAPADAVEAVRRHAPAHHEGGRRHTLIDAMQQVLGVKGESDKSDDQALFRFAHALMHDLRSIDGGAEHDGPGRGHAWGRRSWSDLPERLQALATATAGPAAPAPDAAAEPPLPAPPAVAPTASATASVKALPVEMPPEPELPPQPNPITTTSAAVHLMQVPSSRLLEAYAALRRALGDSAEAATPGTQRDDLAALLDRLSQELIGQAPSSLPTGGVLDLTA